ncbi:MAG: hypothetical protein HYX25_07420 [Candidatus Solibacter usitatus]|nr:hypothetical protein [Candidatus Solibacter usitatus]
MKRLIRSIVRLYPARWRDRYRTEFDALLDDMSLSWRDLFDVLKGALTMRMSMATLGKSVAAFGVAGALLAGALSFTLRDRYRSEAFLVAGRKVEPPELAQFVRMSLSRDSLIGIMEKQHLYARERAKESMDDIIVKMRRDISIAIQGPSSFEVSFDYPDPAQAQQTNAALIGRLMDESVTAGFAGLRAIEKPSTPQSPNWPNRTVITGLGLNAGILMGAIVAWARRPKTKPVV